MGSRSTTIQDDPGDSVGAPGKPDHGGLAKLVWSLRYRRQRYRQFVGVAIVFLISFVGTPTLPMLQIGAVLAILGMLTRLWASGFVMKNEVLATTGPYGYVRHPLYVGNLLICAGFCFASGLWWSVPLSLVFLWYFYPATIRHEDRKLQKYFGEAWDAWAAETHALIPRLTPFSKAQAGAGWSFRRSLMRNGEPLHIVVLGGCLAYLYLIGLG